MNREEKEPPFGFMTHNYLVLTLTSTIWQIPASISNTYFSLYVFGLGGTETAIGLIAAVGHSVFIASAIVGGHVADLYSRKKLVGFMTLFLGLSQIPVVFAPNWQSLILASIAANICWGFEPAYWAMLADSTNPAKRGTAFAIYSCLSFLPWAIMPYVGGYLIDAYDILPVMRWTYVGLATAGLTTGTARLLKLKETGKTQPAKTDVEPKFKKLAKLLKDAFNGHLQTWRWMPRSALALTASYVLWAFEYGLVEPYWIVYAEEIIGITSTQWGIITGLSSAISVLSKILLVGKMLDRFSRRKILLATTAFDTFTYLLFIRSGAFIQVLALMTVSSFVWSFYEPTYSSLEADLIPAERRGRVFAAFSIAWSAFTVPASLLGGLVYERVSPDISFIAASIAVSLCFILTALFIKPPRSKSAKTSVDWEQQ